MKKIFCIFTAVILMLSLSLVVSATETEATVETEEAVETVIKTEEPIEIESEVAADIVDIISKAESKADAIFAVAERLGISYEDAETLVNSVLALGDKYLGENAGWVRFKDSVTANMEFWIIIAVLALVALGILWYSLTNHMKSRKLKNVEYNMVETTKIAAEARDINSQTLAKILEMAAEAEAREKEHKAYVEELITKIRDLKEENVEQDKELIKLQKDMLRAEISSLNIQKLICNRTRLPMADKATIENYFAEGVNPLLANLPEEEASAAEELARTLETVGGIDGEA